MLAAIETYFWNTLKTVFPTGTNVVAGPTAGPTTSMTTLVEIIASQLVFVPDEGEEKSAQPKGRGPAFHTQVLTFPGDGRNCNFLIPANETGDVIEVQSPRGRLVTRGDDYVIEGRTIGFYNAPAQRTDAVVARLRGARARGYEQKQMCQIDMDIRIWAKELAVADELARTALTKVLEAADNMGIVDASNAATPNVTMRLLRANASFKSLRHGLQSKSPKWYTVNIDFVVRGELEQTLVLGEPEPTGIIREVRRSEP
jgi:hypothetical protein